MAKKPRRGRPPIAASERRKHIMSIRVRPKLHEQLMASAEESGRTLSQEVEYLLEKAFDPASPATSEQWLYVVERSAKLADLMSRLGKNLAAKASDAKGVAEAREFEARAKALLDSFPSEFMSAVMEPKK